MMDGPLLVVVAHPDDEALGCGGTLWRASQAGIETGVCVLSGSADARTNRPDVSELAIDFRAALDRLGVQHCYQGDFPNIKFNTVPHLELVQFIEHAIADLRPATIITHHPTDLNIDHQHAAHACLVASRLPQRQSDATYVHTVLLMETLSATDWTFPQLGPVFNPQHFVEIGVEGLEAKIEATACYRGVMREFPHSRSEEAIRGLAAHRGAAAHLRFAEAFEVALHRVPLELAPQ